ncbi:non-ribosomal peptide synthetase [Chryseobacterium gallinarum]|uniref:Amino acid adenylation domain-containing protein n=1 Tax=Chryseobacterium gallinarum TaxID=1324352 RepID=A0ABX6KQ31_CHRGL|nr:non-ribosomal peptide synthetase [Chryseobacterium gallinarum]QIY90736.1 amino acid adenylation domain-containing protein [Chryseobacterium gallinarum]
MTTVIEVLNRAKKNNIHVFVEDRKLFIKLPNKAEVDPAVLGALKEHKESILDFFNQNRFLTIANVDVIPKVDHEKIKEFPLSNAQKRLWIIDKVSGSQNFHIPTLLRLEGKLSIHDLKKAFVQLIERHAVLRTVFGENEGEPFQRVLSAEGWDLNVILDTAEDYTEIISREVNTPFDLQHDYPVRAALIKIVENVYTLVFVIHHIATDEWSTPIIISELMEFYISNVENRMANLKPLSIQYIDYSYWQNEEENKNKVKDDLEYWVKKLEGMEALDLCTDFERPHILSTKGRTLSFTIDKEITEGLRTLSNMNDTTMYMTFFAVINILLGKYSQQDDLCIGTPVANRTNIAIADLVGFFVNTLPIRTQIDCELRFTEFLKQVKGNILEAIEHQNAPFENIIDALNAKRDLSRNPIFQTIFTYNSESAYTYGSVDDLKIDYENYESQYSKFDINFNVSEIGDELQLVIQYCPDLFLEETICQMVSHLKYICTSVIAEPSKKIKDIDIITDQERERLIAELNDTKIDYSYEKTIIDQFEERVLLDPDGLAIISEGIQLTYKDLNDKANTLAHYMIENHDIGSEDIIAVSVPRSHWYIISILAVLKAGACYLPIDLQYPEGRKKTIIQDTKPKLIIAVSEIFDQVMSWNQEYFIIDLMFNSIQDNTANPERRQNILHSLAYIIYTSGTTGKPKGIMIEHKSLINFCYWQGDTYKITSQSRSMVSAGISFDASVLETFPYLIQGAALYIVNDDTIRFDADAIEKFIVHHKISHCYLSPQVCMELIKKDAKISDTKILTGGESVILPKPTSLNLYNNYGPTENTVITTYSKVTEKSIGTIPIGKPISNTEVYIVDENLKFLPKGIVGELCISGAGLARGYLNDENSEKFVKNPFKEGNIKMYRTGDYANWDNTGNLIFRGRKDNQVKIRGFRIDLKEIEMMINELDKVNINKSIVITNENNSQQIVTFLVVKTDVSIDDISEFLKTRLPYYMLPSRFILLEEMPLTSSGKTDIKKLHSIADSYAKNVEPGLVDESNYGDVERELVHIWENVLNKKGIGIYDDFFELGGYSLLATKIVALVEKRFHVKLPLSVFFELPQISSISDFIKENTKQTTSTIIQIQTKGDKKPIYLAPAGGGNVYGYFNLSKKMGENQPLYSFDFPGLDGISPIPETVEEVAEKFIEELLLFDKSNSFILGGYSFGGTIAYEMSLQLLAKGYHVEQLIIIDTDDPVIKENDYKQKSYKEWLLFFKDLFNYSQQINIQMEEADIINASDAEAFEYFHKLLTESGEAWSEDQVKGFLHTYIANTEASQKYIPVKDHIEVPITYFKANQNKTIYKDCRENNDPGIEWRSRTSGFYKSYIMDCSHLTIMDEHNLEFIANQINS